MLAKDLVIHFYTSSFRGSITQAKSITQAIRQRCEIKDLVLSQEIHSAVSSTLLQSILLRGEERVRTVSEHSNESFGVNYNSTVYVEKWGEKYIRGFADKLENSEVIGNGNFMIGKTLYGATEEYKSIHTIQDTNLGLTNKDLQTFYDISEQVPSKIYLNSSGFNNESSKFSGLSFLVQLMPGADKQYLEDLYESIMKTKDFEGLHEVILNEENFKQIFEGVDEEIGFQLKEYEFQCNCNREGMVEFLKKLETSQLAGMKKEIQHIACSYCNQKYEITPQELDPLIK